MNYRLTLVLDSLALILTLVLVLASIVILAVIWRPQIRKRLGLGEGFDKNMLSTFIIGVVTIIVTHTLAKAISESETRAKYVELGVSILTSIKTKPSKEGTGLCPELSMNERALRKWAVGNVRAYSDVPMEPLTEEYLICGGLELPHPIPQTLIDELRARRKAALEIMHKSVAPRKQ